MPRVELYDPTRTVYRCDTLDLARLEEWFGEWLPRLFDGWPDEPGLEPLVSVWPLSMPVSGLPDWPADTRAIGEPFTVPRAPAAAMAALRARHRELIERCEQLRADDVRRGRA
jgi:hypothetical protein